MSTTRPDRTEAAPYFFTYLDKVPDGDIVGLMETQGRDILALLRNVPEARSTHRYAEGKWSIREVVHHMADTERVFSFRALWFARGFEGALPGFDQDRGVAAARAHDRPWAALLDELE